MRFSRESGRRPNWLLIVLIGISVLIHAGLIYEFRDVRQARSQTMIEVEVAAPDPPKQRSLPRPPKNPSSPRAVVKNTDTEIPEDPPVPIPEAESVPAPPADSVPPEPEVAPQKIAKWRGPEIFDPENTGEAKADYFDRIRTAIERNKQYPMRARRRQLEGRVMVAFAIDKKGGISNLTVLQGSGFSVLDAAALSAVRAAAPFAEPPGDMSGFPLRLEIPIMFELAR